MVDFPVFNTPDHPAFSPCMAEIHGIAKTAEVNYSLHYDNGSDQWHARVTTFGPSTEHITKDNVLSMVLVLLCQHLTTLVLEKTNGK